MQNFLALWLILMIVGAAWAGPEEDLQPYLTQENLARLEKGEVLSFKKGAKKPDGTNQGDGRVIAVIERSKDDIWWMLTHNEEQAKFIPHLHKAERYDDTGVRCGVAEIIKLFFKTYYVNVIQTRDEANGVILWHIDKTKKNTINDTTGGWYVKPYGENRSLLMYWLSVDSGAFIPKTIEDFLFNNDLPNVVRAFKKYMETHPEAGKPTK